MNNHFHGKNPLSHVLEKRKEGMFSTAEVHGAEIPDHLSIALEAAKESSVALLLLWLFMNLLQVSEIYAFFAFISFGLGWSAWKCGKCGRLGWQKLERLHRLIEQEKYEIEHHRPQEREELIALYQAKGFEGKLLEDVVDVLMADQDRLLKIMLEEEMGLTLQAYEHPLQQMLGALIGTLSSLACSVLFYFFSSKYGLGIGTVIILATASLLSACFKKNKMIPTLVWDISLATLALGIAFFFFKLLA